MSTLTANPKASVQKYLELLAELKRRQEEDSLGEEEEIGKMEELHDIWSSLTSSEKEKLEDE